MGKKNKKLIISYTGSRKLKKKNSNNSTPNINIFLMNCIFVESWILKQQRMRKRRLRKIIDYKDNDSLSDLKFTMECQ